MELHTGKPLLRTVLAAGAAVLCAAAVMSAPGCGSSNGQAAGQTVVTAPLSLATDAAVEKKIAASIGGWIELADRRAAVYFMPGSLDHDATIVMTPVTQAPAGISGVTIPGFQLEEKGAGDKPELKEPAIVAFPLNDPGEEAVVFKYAGGGYEPLNSSLINDSANVSLMAETDEFSTFGVKNPSEPDSGNGRAVPAQAAWQDAISVDADALRPYQLPSPAGTWSFTSHLVLTATSGQALGFFGAYQGTFNLTVNAGLTPAAEAPPPPDTQLAAASSGEARFTFGFPQDVQLPPDLAPPPAGSQAGLTEPQLEGHGLLRASQDLTSLIAGLSGSGAKADPDFQSRDGGKTWPVTLVMRPGEGSVYVIWAYGTYVGSIRNISSG